MIEKSTTVVLWKDYSADELRELGADLSSTVIERGEVEEAKRSAMGVFKKQLDGIDGKISDLSKSIRAKGRDVATPCLVRFHSPRTAFKQTVRLDTGELVREEQMTPRECQENLFETKQLDELNRMMEPPPSGLDNREEKP